jgi:hypothetical protein
LRVALFATATPYSGGTLSGRVMGAFNLAEVLGPGDYYEDLDETVSYSRPPDGTYYSVLALLEWGGNGYFVADWLNYSGTFTIGTPQPPPGGGDPRFGSWSYRYSGNTLSLTANNVFNHSYTASTGTLSLELWALPSPNSGLSFRGYRVGSFSAPGLRPRYQYPSLSRTVTLYRPPSGTYYGLLVLRDGNTVRYVSRSSNFLRF